MLGAAIVVGISCGNVGWYLALSQRRGLGWMLVRILGSHRDREEGTEKTQVSSTCGYKYYGAKVVKSAGHPWQLCSRLVSSVGKAVGVLCMACHRELQLLPPSG